MAAKSIAASLAKQFDVPRDVMQRVERAIVPMLKPGASLIELSRAALKVRGMDDFDHFEAAAVVEQIAEANGYGRTFC